MRDGPPVVANGAHEPEAVLDLPPVSHVNSVVAKIVANPEVKTVLGVRFATSGKTDDDADLVDEFFSGRRRQIDKISKGWRLEENSNGRWRWRWQIKDDNGITVTYVKDDGSIGYARGSEYVGITQTADARKEDRRRVKGKHKRRGRGSTGR